VSFHCQQCIEKCFKALIEEKDKPFIKSHDLLRLQQNANIQFSEEEIILLEMINEVYIDSRYPGDLGLLPHGKPTISDIEAFIQFCETLLDRLKILLE
jgi:HEPN domain-containing protein